MLASSAHIIDDDELMRDLIRQCLLRMGFQQFVTSKCFIDARNKIQEQVCDVVFLDIELGDGNGLQLIKHMKEKNPKSRIIIVSGHGSTENVKKAIAEGANGFLAKPFSVDKFSQVLKNVKITNSLEQKGR